MEAVRVLRFSGPSAHADALVRFAARAGVDVCELVERGDRAETWFELAIPLARSAGVDDDQVARSLERSVERLGTGFRLREYLTEIRHLE